MTSNELKALSNQYVMNTYGRFPVAIERGEGGVRINPEMCVGCGMCVQVCSFKAIKWGERA